MFLLGITVISLINYGIHAIESYSKTQVVDVVDETARLRWKWAGHVDSRGETVAHRTFK